MLEKNKIKRLLIAALLFTGACSFAPAPETGLPADSIPIDTSDAAQAAYKKQWLEAVTNKVFKNENADVFGGGGSSFFSVFAFDAEGNLHDTGSSLGTWYSLHKIIAFKSANQAVVMFYKSASSPKLHKEIYALEIRGDKIYRTQNVIEKAARGYSTTDKWDGTGYSSENIVLFAPIDTSIAYPALIVPRPNS